MHPRFGRWLSRPWTLPYAVVLLLAPPLAAQSAGERPFIRTVAAVQRLTHAQASRAYPIQLEGVVTYCDYEWGLLFVQDYTGGIYVNTHGLAIEIPAGTRVQVDAVTGWGDVGTILAKPKVHVLGKAALPAAAQRSLAELDSGVSDSRWVAARGVLRPGEQSWDRIAFRIFDGAVGVLVVIPQHDSAAAGRLIGSLVQVSAVNAARLDSAGKRVGAMLFTSSLDHIQVESPAERDARPRAIATLGASPSNERFAQPIHVRGSVTWEKPGLFFLEDASGAAAVETGKEAAIHPGDAVDVFGFPSRGEYGATLRDSVVAPASSYPGQVEPLRITADEVLKASLYGRLVRVRARLSELTGNSNENVFQLEDGKQRFSAILPRTGPEQRPANLARGAMLELTGVAVARQQAGSPSLLLLLRSPADVVLLEVPSWLTLQKVAAIVGAMGIAVIGTLVWITLLRRTVREQTANIRARLEREAHLESEYRRLFERSPAGVFRWRPDGTILDCNPAFARMLGFGARERLV